MVATVTHVEGQGEHDPLVPLVDALKAIKANSYRAGLDLIVSGRLDAVKVRGRRFVRASEIARYNAERSAEPAP